MSKPLIEAPRTSAAPVISAEQAFSWMDAGIVLAVVAVALIYLYNRLWHKRGTCSGCGSKGSQCATKCTTACSGEIRSGTRGSS